MEIVHPLPEGTRVRYIDDELLQQEGTITEIDSSDTTYEIDNCNWYYYTSVREILKEKPMSNKRVLQWQDVGGAFTLAYPNHPQLPAGLYKADMRKEVGPCLTPITVATDHLLNLPGSAANNVLQEIKKFWTLKEEFTKRGLLHKRGILLWGPPGSGKTVTVQQLLREVVEQYRGIGVFVENPRLATACLQMARNIEPDRPIIVMMEDFEDLISNHGEAAFLSLLDGETQIPNVVYVATTNYPETLDKRFTNRPSRFDTIQYIGMPQPDARRAYLLSKEPTIPIEELETWVTQTEGFSVAHLKELIILCKCYQHPFEFAISRLKRMPEEFFKIDGKSVAQKPPSKNKSTGAVAVTLFD